MTSDAGGVDQPRIGEEHRWIDRLGDRQYPKLLLAAIALLDRTQVHVLYFDGAPLVSSSGFVQLSGSHGRRDFTQLPSTAGPAWVLGDRQGCWGHAGRWSVLHFGELPSVAPEAHGLDVTLSHLEGAPELEELGRAASLAARASESRLVFIRDREVLPMSPDLPKSLGFAAGDDSWVPGHWRRPVEPDVVEAGSDVITTGDDHPLPVRITWFRMQAMDHNVYVVRIAMIEGDGFEYWPTTQVPGVLEASSAPGG